MIRFFRLASWFVVGVALVAVPMLSLAAGPVQVYVPGVTYSPSAGGNNYITPPSNAVSGSGPVTITYPSTTINTPVSAPLPPVAGVPAGNQIIQVSTKLTPNSARVAAVAVSLAKRAGPVGVGVQIATIICDVTEICKNSDSDYFEKRSIPKIEPSSYEMTCENSSTGSVVYTQSGSTYIRFSRSPSVAHGCSGESGSGIYNYCPNPPDTNCSFDALRVQQNIALPPGSSSPVTDPDWDSATKKLTDAVNRNSDLLDGLQKQGQPTPIDKPELSPKSETSPPTTTVNRDSAGNIINTTTTNTTTNIAPVTNTSISNTVNITQTTTSVTTGPTGAVTGTTKTDSTPPEPEEPEIKFDEVPDVNLEKQELPLSMPAASSWGEGSCPSDPSVSVLGHPIVVPVHVVCAYMSGVRGAVIALFALISAYIVIGVKFEG